MKKERSDIHLSEFLLILFIMAASFITLWINLPNLVSYKNEKDADRNQIKLEILKNHEVLSNDLFYLIGESTGHKTSDIKSRYMELEIKNKRILLISKYENLNGKGIVYRNKINDKIFCIENKSNKKCYYGFVRLADI